MSQISTILAGMGLMDWVGVVAIISVFIDISPIKVNPIGFVVNRLGSYFNKSIDDKVGAFSVEMQAELNLMKQEFTTQLNTLKTEMEKIDEKQNVQVRKMNDNEIRRLRYEIIEASSSVTNGIKKPIDAYIHIMQVYDDYHRMIEENGLTNGQIVEEFNIVREHYKVNHSKGLTYF